MNPRNILNIADLEADVERVIKHANKNEASPHYLRWLGSTFRRFLINEAPASVCVEESVAKSPLLTILKKALTPIGVNLDAVLTEFTMVNAEELPMWATKALNDGSLVQYRRMSDEDLRMYYHWLDFSRTLPARSLRQTVADFKMQVEAWDKKLAREAAMEKAAALLASANQEVTGKVELIDVGPALDSLEPGHFIVKLIDKLSYAVEAAPENMNNCVLSYFKTKSVIYSLRFASDSGVKHLLTIEVKSDRIVQVEGPAKAPYHRQVDEKYFEAMKLVAEALNLKMDPAILDSDSDDEMDDEDEPMYAREEYDDDEDLDDEDEDSKSKNSDDEEDDEDDLGL